MATVVLRARAHYVPSSRRAQSRSGRAELPRTRMRLDIESEDVSRPAQRRLHERGGSQTMDVGRGLRDDRAGRAASSSILPTRSDRELGAASRRFRVRSASCRSAWLCQVSRRETSRLRSRRDLLLVRGVRRLPGLARDAEVQRLEIPHGRFERRIRLSAARWEIERSVLANGCLHLTLTNRH